MKRNGHTDEQTNRTGNISPIGFQPGTKNNRYNETTKLYKFHIYKTYCIPERELVVQLVRVNCPGIDIGDVEERSELSFERKVRQSVFAVVDSHDFVGNL